MKPDFALDYDAIYAERPQKLYVAIRLSAEPTPDQPRRPLNLSVVLDRSGSMAGAKLDYTRQALQFLIQHLSPQDIFSLVLYNEHVEVVLQPQPVTNKDFMVERVQRIRASGMTNLSGGWLQGCALLEQNLSDSMLNRVILMSDGLANKGVTQTAQLVSLARQKRETHIVTTAMGLGGDFNEDLLMEIAEAGGGAFYFIESPEAAPLIFQEELLDLLNVVGQNLTISLYPTPQISHTNQLNAYNMSTDGQRMSFSLGDIYRGDVRQLMLELTVDAPPTPGALLLARAIIEYDEIDGGSSQRRTFELPIEIQVIAPDAPPPPANDAVRRAVLLLQSARARREAVAHADHGDYGRAAQVLRHAAAMIDQMQLPGGDLEEEHRVLLRQAEDMDRGAEYYNSYSRKLMATQAVYTMNNRHEQTQSLRIREAERLGEIPSVERKPGAIPTAFTWNEHTYPVTLDLIRIGRAPQNEIVIDARNISRFHCQIKQDGKLLLLEDLGSTNGTFVNGVRISEPHVVSVGDVVRIGSEELVFHNHG